MRRPRNRASFRMKKAPRRRGALDWVARDFFDDTATNHSSVEPQKSRGLTPRYVRGLAGQRSPRPGLSSCAERAGGGSIALTGRSRRGVSSLGKRDNGLFSVWPDVGCFFGERSAVKLAKSARLDGNVDHRKFRLSQSRTDCRPPPRIPQSRVQPFEEDML